MVFINSAGLSDVGKKRSNNEDSFLLSDSLGLYLVADGMGGHACGEVASRLVVRTMEAYMASPGTASGRDEIQDDSLSREANRLLASVRRANQQVYMASRQDPRLRGMGSTLAGVLLNQGRLTAVSVGDSAVFWIHDGHLERLFTPHTVLAEQMALDPRQAEAINPAFQHLLTRAMGVEPVVRPDVVEVPCRPKDRVVIASDGLTGKVGEKEIMAIAGKRRPSRACRLLVDMANRRGGDDNITVIILEIGNGYCGSIRRLLLRVAGKRGQGETQTEQPASKGA